MLKFHFGESNEFNAYYKLKELESGFEGKGNVKYGLLVKYEKISRIWIFICDPAFITLNYGTQESGCDVIIPWESFL